MCRRPFITTLEVACPPHFAAFPGRVDKYFIKRVAKWFIYGAQHLGLRRRFEKQLRRDKPALVLFNELPHPHTAVAKSLMQGQKTSLVVHMTPKSYAFFQHSVDPSYTEAWVLEATDAYESLIFVSETSRKEWLAVMPLSAETFVVPNCCREHEVQRLLAQSKSAVRGQLGLLPDDYVAVCVANLIPRKGQDLLVEALAECVKSIPNFKLLLVGKESGSWSKTLHRRVAELGVTDHVAFLGTRADALAFTCAADVFVFLTRAEAQGIAVLEAMALQTPIVATDAGSVAESIRDGEHGLLIPIDDFKSLAAAVVRLSQDQTLKQNLAAQAAHRYWHNFSKSRQVERYGEVLKAALPPP